MTRAAAFTKTDVRRAMQAVESGGACVEAVEFLPGGGFKVLTRAAGEVAVAQDNQDWTELAGAEEISRA